MKKKKTSYPNAVVKEINGQLVLDDPLAVALVFAVGKENCKRTFELNVDRVQHFKNRITEKGLSPNDVVIVLINVDDVHGHDIADVLMPNTNWQEIRDHNEIPFARGLATREGMQEAVAMFDKEAANKLKLTKVAVVVIDHGVAEIFSV